MKTNEKINFFTPLICITIISCGNIFHDIPDFINKTDDPVMPKVVYTYPADKAENVEIDKSILASFNKDMDTATINSSTFIVKKIEQNISNNQTTTVETVIDGDMSLYNKNIIIFKIKNSGKMDPFSNYSVFVSKEIKDMEKHSLADNYNWTFKTSDKEDNTRPEVVSAEPVQYIYFTENVLIKAEFSEDINPFTLSNTAFALKKIGNSVEIYIPGTVSYESSSRTALLIPANPLEVSASYKAYINSPIADLAGNEMISYNWDFRHLKTYKLPCEIPELNLDCCLDCK